MFLSLLVLAILEALVAEGFLVVSLPVGERYVSTSVRNGAVRGESSDVDGMTVDSYYGIPYAKPPLGSLRFKPPEAPPSWSGVRDALTPGPKCAQTPDGDYIDPTPQGEDCLYINVHAQTKSSLNSSLPVMVWIHGGGYRTGEGAPYDGRRLATKGVVLVTFNYRLDALGFLSMEDDLMPGNYGMLDQIAALKWVKDNIASFGGDPQKVTIFGESAGSSSVSLLLLSPLAKGLFQGAIMESGSSVAPWAYAHPARAVSPKLAAKLIGATIGCAQADSLERYRCFQAVNASALLKASRDVSNLAADGAIIMAPRVEQTYGFLPDLPLRLLAQGKFHHVNTIRGFNENEMGFFFNLTARGQTATRETFKNEAVKGALDEFTVVDKDQIALDLVDYYLYNVTSGSIAYAKAEEAFGTDFNFVAPVINEIEMASKTSTGEKHFLYKFSVRPQNSRQPKWVTAVHADEIGFVFGFGRELSDPAHQKAIDSVMMMWTNFAKTGDPNGDDGKVGSNVAWAPFAVNHQNMLAIRKEGIVLRQYDEPTVTGAYFGFMQRIDTAIDPSSIVVG